MTITVGYWGDHDYLFKKMKQLLIAVVLVGGADIGMDRCKESNAQAVKQYR